MPESIKPIERHSVLSDQRTAAVVTSDADVNWMCVPRIDSSALFAALLDGPAAGHFSIAPAKPASNPLQRYWDGSMVLDTSWESMKVTDYLDCSNGRAASPAGRTDLIRAISGSGEAVVEFAPRADFGRRPTRLRPRNGGLEVIGTDHAVCLRSPGVRWRIETYGPHHTARAVIDLSSGPITLELRCGTSDLGPAAEGTDRLSSTVEHWRQWADRLRLPSACPEKHVGIALRSALALKALCHESTGAITAAATTSLPQRVGGTRNWDYRYCWIRDGFMTAATLVRLGSTGEALGLLDWLTQLIDEDGTDLIHLAPLYTVDGGALPPETAVTELAGYRGSRPVRVGNAADRQVQIDVFGPVMELLLRLHRARVPLSERHRLLMEQIVDAVRRCWRHTDQGIWEFRTPPRHYVYSKTMCWTAVDRAVEITRSSTGRTVPEWERLRDAIAADVLAEGWNPDAGAFTAAYGSMDLDSSVLMMGLSGLLAADDPRLAATIGAIESALRNGTAVYQYRCDDGLPGTSNGFNLMTSWLIDAKILVGDIDGARSLFDDYTALIGPTGLLSEEHDPATGRLMGNLPQAYSHLGLIENVLNLNSASRRSDGT